MSVLAQTLNVIREKAEDSTPCPMGRILAASDQEDYEALISALNSKASTRAIHRALRDHGHSIERTSVTLHRDKRCRCSEGNKND